MTAVWADANGGTRSTLLTTSAGAAAVASALVAKSNADIVEDWEGVLTVAVAPVVTAAPLQTVRDVARLIFLTSTNTLVSIILPAPTLSIFFPDETTVDPSQVAGIVAAVIANTTDASGNAVVSFVAGVREPS